MVRAEVQNGQPHRLAAAHSDLQLMALAERNPSLHGRELLRELIERGPLPQLDERPLPRDLVKALQPRALDHTDYRSPIEQAESLNRESKLLRDLYERGAMLKGDTLILPAEEYELSQTKGEPFITTLGFAERRLPERAQAREFHELAMTISGDNADAQTKLVTFKAYYDRLERNDVGDRLPKHDDSGRQAASLRTLADMRLVAAEMARLETRDSIGAEPHDEQPPENDRAPQFNTAARTVNLREEALRFPAELSYETRARLIVNTIPEIDRRLERGVPRFILVGAIEQRMRQPDHEVPLEKLVEISRFLKDYVTERLRDPETRALHSSRAFREARANLHATRTPEELGRFASDFLRTNQQRSETLRLHQADPQRYPKPDAQPLDVVQRNLLFTGRASGHHTSEMRELRLAYGLSRAEQATRTTQLHEGRLQRSEALERLINELATRRTEKAVRHFTAGLLNAEMVQPGRVNLRSLQERLPPHERAYLYEVVQQRQQSFQAPIKTTIPLAEPVPVPDSPSLREYLAQMGKLERAWLNEAVANRNEQRESLDLTITQARAQLPEPVRREIRVQAANAAWKTLVPEEVFARNPSPEALRIGETIALLQEQLQERARTAQAVREDFVATATAKIEGRYAQTAGFAEGKQKLAALEIYAAQTREAVYRGFELLDEQRAALTVTHVVQQEPEKAHLQFEPLSTATPAQVNNQEWQHDSLSEVLAAKFGVSVESQPREPQQLLDREPAWER